MKTIKYRLVKNFFVVILISVTFFEALLISFVKHYYYNNVEEVLTNQIKTSADFYYRYFSDNSLEDNILDNVDVFWKQTSAQVQIINTTGKVLMDSIGVISKNKLESSDYLKALHGEKGKWIGKVDYDNEPIMAISYPLKSGDKIVGVIRFITSLREVNKAMRRITLALLSIGAVVLIISSITSIFLANSITDPLKEVTDKAEKMAGGDLKVRSKKTTDDEIGKLSHTLDYMADEIVKKEQLKNEFISSISHELRTPLTAIKGWAVTLNNEEFGNNEVVRDGLFIIEKETERLTAMVEELLDFSKFVSDKVTLKRQLVVLEDIIEEVKKIMEPRALRENIVLTLCCEKDIPKLFIDYNRIKQVLINLLDNAFNFIEKDGQVLLTCKRENDNVVISVSDNGCGIEKNEICKVKERFYKGKSSKSQNGLGLSICDEIINLHGGKLEIESEVKKGTTVYVKLPVYETTKDNRGNEYE